MALHDDALPTFRSLRVSKRVQWGWPAVINIADQIWADFPAPARELVLSGKFKGTMVVKLANEVVTPTELDIENNFVILAPLCKVFTTCVPGCFLLADALIYLNLKHCESKLLNPLSGETVETLAVQEASKLKRLMQKLRDLWRRWPTVSVRPLPTRAMA